MRIRGVDIHYEISGVDRAASARPSAQAPAGKPVLVLLHGFGATLHTWDDLMPGLEAAHTVLRVDLKGFGKSGKPADGAYSLDEHAEIIAELVRRESLTRIVLIGHSYGGAVAVLTWLKLSGGGPRVDGLVLVDSASYQQRLPFFITLYRLALTRWAVPLFSASWRARFVLEHLYVDKSRVSAGRVEHYADAMRMPGLHESATKIAKQILPADFAEVTRIIRSIDVPTLILWGARDRAVPLRFAHRLHEDIRGSELEIFPNVGHMPQEERPELVLAALVPFLSALHLRST